MKNGSNGLVLIPNAPLLMLVIPVLLSFTLNTVLGKTSILAMEVLSNMVERTVRGGNLDDFGVVQLESFILYFFPLL